MSESFKTKDFSFDLPAELIAQTPVEPRDASRLMVLGRKTGEIEHRHFRDIVEFLQPGDCLVLNDSRVLPARIYGKRADTGTRVEFLLLRDLSGNRWEALAGPGKRARTGKRFIFDGTEMTCSVEAVQEDGNRILQFETQGNFYTELEKIGQMPLPPYIKETLADQDRYQTVYARETGSAAAPTAGLHFTPELLDRIRAKGVSVVFVTLHVGLGTFRPVSVENISDHKMHSEHYAVSEETARTIHEAKARGGRIVAVGTTSCRTLESVAQKHGEVVADDGWTDIFISPGYTFRAIDALITNFHLPESTLIMLVSAFCGRENILNAYRVAIQERYRFFSFGDAMLIS